MTTEEVFERFDDAVAALQSIAESLDRLPRPFLEPLPPEAELEPVEPAVGA